MNRKNVLIAAVAALVFSMIVVAGPLAAQSSDVLKPGQYTAKVKALVCAGCGPLIQRTMQKMKEIESVSVDSPSSTLKFSVKKGSSLKMSDLQKALKDAAAQMGMGADYTLSDLKPAR